MWKFLEAYSKERSDILGACLKHFHKTFSYQILAFVTHTHLLQVSQMVIFENQMQSIFFLAFNIKYLLQSNNYYLPK